MLLSFDGHFFQSARAIYTDRNKSSPRRHGDTEKSKGKTYRRFARMIADHENANLNFPESALPRITRIYTDQKSSPFSGRRPRAMSAISAIYAFHPSFLLCSKGFLRASVPPW